MRPAASRGFSWSTIASAAAILCSRRCSSRYLRSGGDRREVGGAGADRSAAGADRSAAGVDDAEGDRSLDGIAVEPRARDPVAGRGGLAVQGEPP